MKLTGKLIEHGLTALTEITPLINGRRTPRILILAADHYFARLYKKTGSYLELICEAEPEESLIETEINNKTMGRMVSR